MENSTWLGIRERVQSLGADARSSRVFGSVGHGFVLDDPLGAAELADLEARLGVELPEEYRQFLLQVGAGGAGPGYGVFPVRRTDGRWQWEGDGADLADLHRLAEPFPVRHPAAEQVEQLLAERPEEEDFAETEAFDEAEETWDEHWGRTMFSPDRTAGAIVLAHLGCALREWLVVTGPERGRIWTDHRTDDMDLIPLLDDQEQPVTFARWYLTWLEQSERTTSKRAGRG
ncbi:SMI1/KNR4 family protein [Kitasatospora sp. NPDC002227]|uniref:SMI1/KNR4 family protein n=1 Tax=Kitasatospora sp. NPDC002227 TaxID=3154773 RepID=UPI00331945D3